MNRHKTYTSLHRFSSSLMMLALFWMTISIPFVQQARQTIKHSHSIPVSAPDEEDTNPFANNTEEKCAANAGFSEEYIHHTDLLHAGPVITLMHARQGHVPLYIAFHGELLSPPPELS